MGNGTFNIAKGRVGEFYYRVKNNDPSTAIFKLVLLKVDEVDDTLNNYDDLATLLAGTCDEANFTNYIRKELGDSDLAAIPAPNDTTNLRDFDLPDVTWTSAGGAVNNTLARLLVVYFTSTGAADSTAVPCTYHDFVVTTDGSDLTAQVDSNGFYRASQ